MIYTGQFLVFFNRHTDAPRVWTIAAPGRAWEVNVVGFRSEVILETRYDARHIGAPNHDGPPAAWLEGYGRVSVNAEGHADIEDVEDVYGDE